MSTFLVPVHLSSRTRLCPRSTYVEDPEGSRTLGDRRQKRPSTVAPVGVV